MREKMFSFRIMMITTTTMMLLLLPLALFVIIFLAKGKKKFVAKDLKTTSRWSHHLRYFRLLFKKISRVRYLMPDNYKCKRIIFFFVVLFHFAEMNNEE